MQRLERYELTSKSFFQGDFDVLLVPVDTFCGGYTPMVAIDVNDKLRKKNLDVVEVFYFIYSTGV